MPYAWYVSTVLLVCAATCAAVQGWYDDAYRYGWLTVSLLIIGLWIHPLVLAIARPTP